MANMFGDLYIGNSGIQGANNAINVVANNLTNVNTEGYVRQQVLFSDTHYNTYSKSATAPMQYGLGVKIADVIHARDMFLDKSFRTESGRAAFYDAGYEVIKEVEDILQEVEGEAFSDSINDFYEAFQEFAKDPHDTVNQNILIQRSQLFLARSNAVNASLKKYQTTINTQIKNDVKRINELGKIIKDCNLRIQKVEAGGLETAMDIRDARDAAVDELSKLANISVNEDAAGVYYVRLENIDFVDMNKCYEIALKRDNFTGYVTPYWPQLSVTDRPNPKDNFYKIVFDTYDISAERRNDVGEVKALLLARGDKPTTYLDFLGLDKDPDDYEKGIGNSVVTNTESEIDKLVHEMVTAVNDMLCPNTAYDGKYGDIQYTDTRGRLVTLKKGDPICDVDACVSGSDGKVPPEELFTRIGCPRYTEVTPKDAAGNPILDANGNPVTLYVYNQEQMGYPHYKIEYTDRNGNLVTNEDDKGDTSQCYTLSSLRVNENLIRNESLLAHLNKDGSVAYKWGEEMGAMWSRSEFVKVPLELNEDGTGYKRATFALNPLDTTPCAFTDFYTKFVGELANTGTVYATTGDTINGAVEGIEYQRQQVIGVSSDEELSNMIQFQSAYNAASRYINVISQMIEHIITSL